MTDGIGMPPAGTAVLNLLQHVYSRAWCVLDVSTRLGREET